MKKFVLALLTMLAVNVSYAGSGKIMNIKYSTATGPAIDFALGKFSIGAGVLTSSGAAISGTDSYTYAMTFTDGRLAWYSNGMGASSWYIAADAGTLGITVTQVISSVDYTGTVNASFTGGAMGYHWFGNHFNFVLGAGAKTYNLGDLQVKDSSGTVGNTIAMGSMSLPVIELGLGYAF